MVGYKMVLAHSPPSWSSLSINFFFKSAFFRIILNFSSSQAACFFQACKKSILSFFSLCRIEKVVDVINTNKHRTMLPVFKNPKTNQIANTVLYPMKKHSMKLKVKIASAKVNKTRANSPVAIVKSQKMLIRAARVSGLA